MPEFRKETFQMHAFCFPFPVKFAFILVSYNNAIGGLEDKTVAVEVDFREGVQQDQRMHENA